MQTERAGPAAGNDSPLARRYLALLVPLVLTHVLQSLEGAVDGIWVGHLLGVRGLAAMAAFFPLFFVLLSVIIGLGAAASILAGQAWGARDAQRLRRVAATALAGACAAGLVVSVVGAWWTRELLQSMHTPPDVLHEATRYARALLVAMPLTFVLWTCMSLARGAGDALSPMWALAVACALGAMATPVLLVGAFGAPRLGVPGAAVSTILAQGAALAFLLARWKRSGHPLAPGSAWRGCAPQSRIAATMLRIGLPAAMQMLTMALAEMVLLGLVNRHGSGVTAAYGAATQLLSWVQFPAMSLGIAASILSAQAMGAGRAARLPAILASGLRLNALVTTAFVAVAHLAAPVALRLFVTDDEVLGIAVGLFRTVAWSVVLFGWSNVLVGTMRASGTVLLPTALGMLAIVAAELPAAVLLEARFGLQGLWWSWPIGLALMLLLQAVYCGRVWRHAPVLRPA